MKKILPYSFAILILAFLTAPVFAACPDPLPTDTLCVEWVAPTENTDGTPLTDLAGFEAYLNVGGPVDPATAQRIDIPDPLADTLVESTVSIPSPGIAGGEVDVYVRMTAYDDDGNVSELSNEVIETVTFPDLLPPGAPQVLQVLISIDT